MRRGFEVKIEEPCDAPWNEMLPEARSRFCERCSRSVHDLARMSSRDVETLALRAAAGELICVRIMRDAAGELVTLRQEMKTNRSRAAIFSTALAIGLPAAAQSSASNSREKPVAVLTGTLRRPDGGAVNSGLIQLTGHDYGWRDQVYVVDEIGNFELDVPPGKYDLVVQTGEKQARSIGAVELHEGPQSVGTVLTRVGAVNTIEMMPLLGTMSASFRTRLGLKTVFRHPVFFTRSVFRRRS